jgi:hypothetical protein
MAQQPLLDMLHFKRLAQQWIGAQVDHPGGQVIARPPVRVSFAEFIF